MVPFIIGGIVLTATGYGVKKILENVIKDNLSFDDLSYNNDYSYIIPELREYVENFENASRRLYNSSLLDLETAISEIRGLNREIRMPCLSPKGKQFNFASVNDEIKSSFERYTAILVNIKERIDIELDKLDEILLKSNDYSSYSDEEKSFIHELINIQDIIYTATQITMTVDKEHFTREVKRAFKKLENIIKHSDL